MELSKLITRLRKVKFASTKDREEATDIINQLENLVKAGMQQNPQEGDNRRKYDPEDYIKVINTEENGISTSVVKQRLIELNKKYENIDIDWLKKSLIKLASEGKIERYKPAGVNVNLWKRKGKK